MTGMKLATFLLLILVLELMLFSDTVVLWRRRRRRRYIPPPPSCDSQKPHSQTPWVNNWRGRFDYECPFGKF